MMQILLGMWNYEVVVASAAVAALHQIQSQPYDLSLLDTCFPEISDLELCEQICGFHGHAPVVFISAAVYETDKQNGLQAGAKRSSWIILRRSPSLARPHQSFSSLFNIERQAVSDLSIGKV